MTTTRNGEPRRVVVLQGGLRTPSSSRMLADQIARAVQRAGQGALEVEVIDLRDHAHAVVDAMLAGFAAPGLQAVLDAVATADGIAVVTPTFSASVSGMVKSFFDVLEPGAIEGTPVLLAATGGTERHSLVIDHALRPLFSYLGAEPVRTGVFAATSDFGAGGQRLEQRVGRAAGELVSRMAGRTPTTRSDAKELADSTPQQTASAAAPAGFGDDLVDFESLMDTLGVGR